jgi:hypothetical protein
LIHDPYQFDTNISIESILQVRLDTIQRLLDIWYGYIDELLKGDSIFCKHGEAMCDNLAHGSLSKAMSNFDLYPVKTASEINISINELRENLVNIRANVLPSHSILFDHSKCHWVQIEKMIEEVILDTPNPTLEVHRQQMNDALITLTGIDAEYVDEEEQDEFEY